MLDAHKTWAEACAVTFHTRARLPAFLKDDVCGAAVVGLWRACRRWAERNGDRRASDNEFRRFAWKYVHGEMKSALRESAGPLSDRMRVRLAFQSLSEDLCAEASPEDHTEARAAVLSYLEIVSPRERLVLKQRYFKQRTLAEVGSSLGVSYETVRRLETRAIAKIRARLGVDNVAG